MTALLSQLRVLFLDCPIPFSLSVLVYSEYDGKQEVFEEKTNKKGRYK